MTFLLSGSYRFMTESGLSLLQPASVPLTSLDLPEFAERGVSLDLLRLDMIHPLISGNKWFKLSYALDEVLRSDCRRVLSFGGAWSNHIHALAFAGYQLGIETIGVIRGERPQALSETLVDAERWGMTLHFCSRAEYRCKTDEAFVEQLRVVFGEFHLLPEGGSGPRVIQGCSDIMRQFNASEYELICCACGTGGTLAGLLAAKPGCTRLLGVAALKGGGFLYQDIRRLLAEAGVADPQGWSLALDDHEGGYGKLSPELAGAIEYFENHTGVGLEPVYTGKAFLALRRALLRGELESGQRVLLVHTGGMQGMRGMKEKLRRQLQRYKNEYNVSKTSA